MSFNKNVRITEEMVRQFATAVNDFNPLHLDEAYASTTQFKRPIAHGALLGGIVSGMLVEFYGEGTIYVSTHLKFLNPVFVGDEVTIMLSAQSATKYTNVHITVTNALDYDKPLITGLAEIIPGESNG